MNHKIMNNQHFIWKSDSIYGNASAAITNAFRELGVQKHVQAFTALKVDGMWVITIQYNN